MFVVYIAIAVVIGFLTLVVTVFLNDDYADMDEAVGGAIFVGAFWPIFSPFIMLVATEIVSNTLTQYIGSFKDSGSNKSQREEPQSDNIFYLRKK